ncbi:hypothetical protein [Deinococcus multiflagellatus]|uniref:hypothetical protein n=1 Tax=Deinococcus multiflagellatus TaxID=1656887 RepID=UPI001CCA3EBE|nr:hypothetical protein [Deinococcus multiflagellatus]MBZ9714714.1 hypothetical protein [Deinococcus multiflagellatus]
MAAPLRTLLGTLALGLSACAPQTTTTVQANTPVSAVSFYPHEPGLAWTYLLEGEAADQPAYLLRALGPTVFFDQPTLAFQMTGRGADQTWYRTVSSSGVLLHGLRKPGVTIRLQPPWREAPAEAEWRVGLSWQGQSQVTVSADDGKEQARGTLTYTYVVQDRRMVQTPGGKFEVWVVTRQLTDTLGGLFPATQQLWFTPFVGDVRTPEGLLLTGRNFTARTGGR